MPIYAYRCSACGHAKDVLQKLSDPVLSVCPACGAATFSKQVTAAGFQLKGSGWYVTDFRDGNKGAKAADKSADKASDKPAETSADKSADSPSPAPAAADKSAAAPAPSAPASPSPAPSPSSS
jgi:putative FmdB family regulatory protein